MTSGFACQYYPPLLYGYDFLSNISIIQLALTTLNQTQQDLTVSLPEQQHKCLIILDQMHILQQNNDQDRVCNLGIVASVFFAMKATASTLLKTILFHTLAILVAAYRLVGLAAMGFSSHQELLYWPARASIIKKVQSILIKTINNISGNGSLFPLFQVLISRVVCP